MNEATTAPRWLVPPCLFHHQIPVLHRSDGVWVAGDSQEDGRNGSPAHRAAIDGKQKADASGGGKLKTDGDHQCDSHCCRQARECSRMIPRTEPMAIQTTVEIFATWANPCAIVLPIRSSYQIMMPLTSSTMNICLKTM